MEEKKIKVVWVCRVSNNELRKKLCFNNSCDVNNIKDRAKWNTNAINEFKKFTDIELHVIFPHTSISPELQEFNLDGINFHIFRPEEDTFWFKFRRKIFKGKYETPDYNKNTSIIISLINDIKPDIVHYIGAENPEFSSSALKVDKKYPLLISLQTLMCDPEFKSNYPINDKMYNYRKNIEVNIIKKANFVCCISKHFKDTIKSTISDKIRFLNLSLAVGENINTATSEKQYDFVYYALDINKAADWAIEAFAWAHERRPGITLRIVGGYTTNTKLKFDKRLEELNIAENVTFSGSLPTHDDVIEEVRKARFALLPLKIDLISGTIREAMANGLPIVTTVTPATPQLNVTRESVLLSEKGDHKAMAENMLKLLDSKELVEKLKANAFATIKERYDNASKIECWHDAYFEIIKHMNNGSPISMEDNL